MRLIEARTQRSWSQHEVAARVGTTFVNVSRWERGLTKPGPYYRRKLCQLFGKTEEELDLGAMYLAATFPTAPPAQPARPPSTSQRAPVPPVEPPFPQLDTRLVGRDLLLAHLRQLITGDGPVPGVAPTIALHGIPGVGKTALALALAHDREVRAHFPGGVLWVELGPAPLVPELARQWGVELGMPASAMASLQGNRQWSQGLYAAMGNRHMLLVIDDAWRVSDAQTFMVGGTGCAHLVTTRFPPLAVSLTIQGPVRVTELDERDGLTLLRQLAPQLAGLELTTARGLVLAVGGLPLALTRMGNYMHTYTSGRRAHMRDLRRGTVLGRLNNVLARFRLGERWVVGGGRTGQPGERRVSLQSALETSFLSLDEASRSVLRRLSRWPPKPESFTEEAALQAGGCDLDTLDALCDAGLLEVTADGWYMLHATIADYARTFL